MRFNENELAELAVRAGSGDHEGRMTYKAPPKTLYDTAYKERWFKLTSNMLFYYRLNEFGGAEKNEPTGVFVMENFDIQKEEEADLPFGFSLVWKDEPDKKHLFFTHTEASLISWMNRLLQASYEHKRAQLLALGIQIRRKTGKDPLGMHGTPLLPRIAHCRSSQASFTNAVPVRAAPLPPPRSKNRQANGSLRVAGESSRKSIGRDRASFRCHLMTDYTSQEKMPSLLD